MKILKARYLLLCDDKFSILENSAVAFDEEIKEIGDFEKLKEKFPKSEIYEFENDIAMPALSNLHTHLEFSANSTTLNYGSFLPWVKSVIENRETLFANSNEAIVQNAIKNIIKSGVGTIGAISSAGLDLKPCKESLARVVYFNEILGANKNSVEKSWSDGMRRYEMAAAHQSKTFMPSIAIHAPYSTSKELVKRAVSFAKENNLVLSAHYLESKDEKIWLQKGSGGFKKWLLNFTKEPKSDFTKDEFVEFFYGVKTLFTHCVWVDDFEIFDKDSHSVTHCAFSNRLLSQKSLSLKKLLKAKTNLTIGTDGLSSNISLNLLDELRANLLIFKEFDVVWLAKLLILASTKNAAKALGIKNGEIKERNLADFAIFKGFKPYNKEQIPLQLILQNKEAKAVFVGGELIYKEENNEEYN